VTRVALVTCRAYPQLAEDDRLLRDALMDRGVAAEPVVWDEAAVEWAGFDAVVIRSTWDYHLQAEAFDAWISGLERSGVPLWNPPEVLRWNSRKTYLRELETAGIPTVPTRFIEQGGAPLASVLRETGWDEVVVKPVVSASAYETWRASRATLAQDAARYARLVAEGAVMVQPFLSGIMTDGEWSLCFFAGRYSHAVLKRPRPGDFRVQADHGGEYTSAQASRQLVAEAEAALRAAGRPTLYARVDGCVMDGTFRLMELELLEPGLFLATDTGAADRFADAVIRATGQE
jgi:glutathione synthase/RimK-type ligase-like ATP-grasp enzyme